MPPQWGFHVSEAVLQGCSGCCLEPGSCGLACPNPGISGGMAPSRGGNARTYLLLSLQRKHFYFVLFYFVLHFFLFPTLSLHNTQYFVTVLIQPPLERLRKRETLLRCLILLLISGPLSHLSFVFEDEVQTWL